MSQGNIFTSGDATERCLESTICSADRGRVLRFAPTSVGLDCGILLTAVFIKYESKIAFKI